MESHVLNTYHQASFRTIGLNILRSTSESLSSEGSCNQNSPEYIQLRPKYSAQYERKGLYWRTTGQDWSKNQTINMTRSLESSSDEEENIEVQEVSVDNLHLSEAENTEETSLIEGDDYDVIQVYAVDPNLDFEVSSDDEEHEDHVISRKVHVDNTEYLNTEHITHEDRVLTPDVLNFNLDTPVVSHVDEYFIKEDKEKDILAAKDGLVVKDVDEYFIKTENTEIPTAHDVFVANKLPKEETQIDNPITVNVDEFFVTNTPVAPLAPRYVTEKYDTGFSTANVTSAPENVVEEISTAKETEREKIEELKRYLFGDIPYSKFKHEQRSCSLPQSPMHNICLDVDDTKTCLSFEDLDIDLSDLSFEKDKSSNNGKNDDIPRTLTEEDVNSFLITSKPGDVVIKTEDDLSYQDNKLENPVEITVNTINTPSISTSGKDKTLTPRADVLDFCVEKPALKKEIIKVCDIKTEVEDFVDVESCTETIIPVLEANTLNSLLEQFEATEKLNTKPKRPVIKAEEQKVKNVSLANGTRLQDAGVQLNKNKMRQILMPSAINATVTRSPSPVHSDHDYCSSKKRYSLPNIKRGQSLLKPEVLSSNNKILNSRHRSCKDKKVVYDLSSDDESEKCNAKNKKPNIRLDTSDVKLKKSSVKQTVKVIPNPTRKKLSPPHSVPNDSFKDKSNNSVIVDDACKASDTPSSQNYNSSIKLTIKNKSEVILNCDDKNSQKYENTVKCKSSSVSEKTINKIDMKNKNKSKTVKNIKKLDSERNKTVINVEKCNDVNIKEEPRSREEHFYTALFSNKLDVQFPPAMQSKKEKRSFEEEISIMTRISIKTEVEQPTKKKKLNLQEYKLRRGVNSNNSSATVSPEAIFPDMPISCVIDKATRPILSLAPPIGPTINTEEANAEAPKKLFDPIRDASRKILMNTKKQKAEATRKRDEDIVMSKIPKVENLQLQPLISEAEMMKIVGMTTEKPVPIPKPQLPAEYDEIVMVSVGINTDEKVFKELEKAMLKFRKTQPPADPKSPINFRIKKSDHILKQNIFDTMKRDKKSPFDEKKLADAKIDQERYKDITAALKSVEKHVDTKISSNSLFASIQDVVMKKAPEKKHEKRLKSRSPKKSSFKYVKTPVVRDYDPKAEHGEDKVILYLDKDRVKPSSSHFVVQTDPETDFHASPTEELKTHKIRSPAIRRRNDSDMSMSSDDSSIHSKELSAERSIVKSKPDKQMKRSQSKEKRSRSRERYDRYKKSRSQGRKRRRSYSLSRSRSRSRGRFRRYRRSDSPYRRKRRSRSPYRPSRRSPSPRRSPSIRKDYRSNRSRSRNTDKTRSKSPVVKKLSPQHIGDKKFKSLTPPSRKSTVSESSDYSTGSSYSSSSNDSRKSGRSSSPYRREEYRNKVYGSLYSSEDRDNTPVEERRIVFVGRLEKDVSKASLRAQFSKFGFVLEVRLHTKEDGTRYGFVTYRRARDAWSAVEAAGTFPQYDVGFGGRRAFCGQSYADLDGLEAKYTEIAFHGSALPPPVRRADDMSFEQMLLDMKQKLSQRKGVKKSLEDSA